MVSDTGAWLFGAWLVILDVCMSCSSFGHSSQRVEKISRTECLELSRNDQLSMCETAADPDLQSQLKGLSYVRKRLQLADWTPHCSSPVKTSPEIH